MPGKIIVYFRRILLIYTDNIIAFRRILLLSHTDTWIYTHAYGLKRIKNTRIRVSKIFYFSSMSYYSLDKVLNLDCKYIQYTQETKENIIIGVY